MTPENTEFIVELERLQMTSLDQELKFKMQLDQEDDDQTILITFNLINICFHK